MSIFTQQIRKEIFLYNTGIPKTYKFHKLGNTNKNSNNNFDGVETGPLVKFYKGVS